MTTKAKLKAEYDAKCEAAHCARYAAKVKACDDYDLAIAAALKEYEAAIDELTEIELRRCDAAKERSCPRS